VVKLVRLGLSPKGTVSPSITQNNPARSVAIIGGCSWLISESCRIGRQHDMGLLMGDPFSCPLFRAFGRRFRRWRMRSGALTSRRATSCCAAPPLTIRQMPQLPLITASSARTHPSLGIHACKRRSARVPRSVWFEHLSRTRRRDWLQAIGAW